MMRLRTGVGDRDYLWLDAARVVAVYDRDGYARVKMEDGSFITTIETVDDLVTWIVVDRE